MKRTGRDLKYHATLGMTALVKDDGRSILSGTVIEITQLGVRVEHEDKSNRFIKWDNVLDMSAKNE